MNAFPQSLPDDEAIEDAATEWLCERDAGFAPGREAAFHAWCAADPRHTAAVARIERAMEMLEELPTMREPLQARLHEEAVPPARTISFPRAAWLGGLAAALVLGTVAWWHIGTRATFDRQFSADASAPQQVALNDGSVLNVNTRSEVRVRLTPRERQITLGSGEAHFEVAHDAARPFVVHAGGVVVRAVGTAFNVRLAESGVEVIVTEGRVRIEQEDAPAPAAPPVAAGERAWVPLATVNELQVQKIAPEELQRTLAWHNPVASFSAVPLREAIAQFNRRNTVQLVLADAELADRKIGGSFALDQVEAFVRLLEQDGDVVSERRGGNEIVLRRAR